MQAFQFFKSVTTDKSSLLERLLKLLQDNNIQYCVIGGVAVSAYTEPLVSLDVDIVITNYQLGRFESLLANTFLVKRGPRLIEITTPNSALRVNVHTDSRLAEFVGRAGVRSVLDLDLPVARLEDVLAAKLWAVDDGSRSGIKRQKDLLDIARIVQVKPQLRSQLPGSIQQRLVLLGV